MASLLHSDPRRAQYPEASDVVGQRRDVTWGRILFLPPELTNPRIIFDPLPFRGQHFAPAHHARQHRARG